MNHYYKIEADDENNAELFWGNIDEQMPEIADQLRDGEATVDAATWAKLQAIEGFAGGPAYAPNALIVLDQMATFDDCKVFDANGCETQRSVKVTFSDDSVLIGTENHDRTKLDINWQAGRIKIPNDESVTFDPSQHTEFSDVEKATQDANAGYGDDFAALPDEMIE